MQAAAHIARLRQRATGPRADDLHALADRAAEDLVTVDAVQITHANSHLLTVDHRRLRPYMAAQDGWAPLHVWLLTDDARRDMPPYGA